MGLGRARGAEQGHGAVDSGSRHGAEARRHGEDLERMKGKVLASGAERSAG